VLLPRRNVSGAHAKRGAGTSRANETAALIAAWFGDSTVIDLVDTRTGEVGGRLQLTYRFEGVEEGEPYVVQQELFCTLDHGKIAAADLLCSGFLPRAPAG